MDNHDLKQDLTGAWQFQPALGKEPGDAWLAASVPGDVHCDLMAAGRLADPHVGENEADAAWVSESAWWYRRRFVPDAALLAAERASLVAEGLDTWCTLWLNGRRLGKSDNMFVEQRFDVSGRLRPGMNELLLRFDPPGPALQRLERRYGRRASVGDPLRAHARKAQYGFGWDWGPRLPSCGVFKPIRLEAVGAVRICDLLCRTLAASAQAARGELVLTVDCLRATRLPLRASLGPWSVQRQLRLKAGRQVLRLPWRLARPRLWWPRGYGEPFLYQARVQLGDGSVAVVSAGIRTVALERKPDAVGQSFGFKVNGVPVYAKGANWIPPDSFMGRVPPARVEALVEAAAGANMTLLRVWGGGLYESEAFYGACDRRGLLVWQDFPFACQELSEHPEFLAKVKVEAEAAVTRLRRHPSLALWCGNNENHWARYAHWFRGREAATWGRRIYHRVLPAVCRRLDPDRPYWPGSPYLGADPNDQARGDRHHWQVWAQQAGYEAYRQDRGRFISEFGFAALPNRRALARALTPQDRWAQSRALGGHDKVEGGGALATISYFIAQYLPQAGGLDAFRYLSQVNQALALRCGFEHWRRLKPHNQGALVWQLNDCWPAMSWSLLDADDTPKLAWFATRAALDDCLLSSVEAEPTAPAPGPGRTPLRARDEDGRCEAWLSLDGRRLGPLKGVLRVERWGMDGSRTLLDRVAVSVPAGASQRLWQRRRQACGVTDPAREVLVFHLVAPGLRRRSLLMLARPKHLDLPSGARALGLTVTAQARAGAHPATLTLRTRGLAMACELHAPVDGRFSDNGFDLLPGEARTVTFTPTVGTAPLRGYTVMTLNQLMREAHRP